MDQLYFGSSGRNWDKMEANGGKQRSPSIIFRAQTEFDKMADESRFWVAMTFFAVAITEE